MSAAVPMYTMKPFYDFSEKIVLPQVMYPLPRLQGGLTATTTDHLSEVPAEMLALKERQEKLLSRLDNLITSISTVKPSQTSSAIVSQNSTPLDVVVYADPDQPPRSLKMIHKILQTKFKVLWKVHSHSSLGNQPFNTNMLGVNEQALDRSHFDIIVTVIFKKVERGCLSFVNPSLSSPMSGESTLARLFARHLAVYDSGAATSSFTTKMDMHLDACDVISSSCTSQAAKMVALQLFEKSLQTSTWLCGSQPTIVDSVAISVLKNSSLPTKLPLLKKFLHNGSDLVW